MLFWQLAQCNFTKKRWDVSKVLDLKNVINAASSHVGAWLLTALNNIVHLLQEMTSTVLEINESRRSTGRFILYDSTNINDTWPVQTREIEGGQCGQFQLNMLCNHAQWCFSCQIICASAWQSHTFQCSSVNVTFKHLKSKPYVLRLSRMTETVQVLLPD